jgi:hypothetical protein
MTYCVVAPRFHKLYEIMPCYNHNITEAFFYITTSVCQYGQTKIK